MDLKTISAEILSSQPDILKFKYWHLLSDRPIPRRINGQTNKEYLKDHWKKLKYLADKTMHPDKY